MIKISTPSRLCLFGEHQDYLGLDVIALAIDLALLRPGGAAGGQPDRHPYPG